MSGIILLPVLETLSKEAIYKENKQEYRPQAFPKLSKEKTCSDAKIASSGMRLMFRVVTSLFTGARGTDWPE